MKAPVAPTSGPAYFYASRPAEQFDEIEPSHARRRWRLLPYAAFFVMVFASMAAAATLVSTAPMMLLGLY